jgi:hypothetical protein
MLRKAPKKLAVTGSHTANRTWYWLQPYSRELVDRPPCCPDTTPKGSELNLRIYEIFPWHRKFLRILGSHVPVIYQKNVTIVSTAPWTLRFTLNALCSSLNCYLPNLHFNRHIVHFSAQQAELDGETRPGEPALQQYASNRLQQLKLTIHLYWAESFLRI